MNTHLSKKERLEIAKGMMKGEYDNAIALLYLFSPGDVYVIMHPGPYENQGDICLAIDLAENKYSITLLMQNGTVKVYHWTRIIPYYVIHDFSVLNGIDGTMTFIE